MYHALLTNRYLTSRVIPLIAVGAVALCVALVIVVVSVMTGFLDMVKSSGRTLMGDVVISYPVSGIPHYERLIERLETLPEAEAAAPIVDGWGLLKMPYPDGPDKQTETVQLWGIDDRFAKVTGYAATVHWKAVDERQWKRLYENLVSSRWRDALEMLDAKQRVEFIIRALSLNQPPDYTPPDRQMVTDRVELTTDDQWLNLFEVASTEPKLLEELLSPAQWAELLAFDSRLADPSRILADGLTLQRNGSDAIALGMHVSEGNERQKDGTYRPMSAGHWWMPAFEVILTTLPITGGGLAEPESVILPVANEFVSGVFLIDDKRVMIPLHVAQRLLHMDEAERVDPDDPTITLGEDPARATMVLVRAREGFTPQQLRDAVEVAYDEFRMEILNDAEAVVIPPAYGFGLSVRTWEQQQAQFIGPVEKERELMRTLFSIVYLVCAALVLSIFWAIVYEKTRDIGIMRSVGASRGGIVWIFLRYGFVVGAIGSVTGLGFAYLIVRNINSIHTALAEPPRWLAFTLLGLAAAAVATTITLARKGSLLTLVIGTLSIIVLTSLGLVVLLFEGVTVWDPSVYYFSRIPSAMDLATALTTMIGAVAFSLLGALIPAAKAADTDPVKALRYE